MKRVICTADITGLLLAGGKGSRMAGADKGLQLYGGRPLVVWTLEKLSPQVGTLLISANRNLNAYASLGHQVLADDLPDFPGPLAGVLAALNRCPTPWLATAPCDVPGLLPDLICRLAQAALDAGAPLAVARTPDGPQPVFMLVRRDLAPSLAAFLKSGERRLQTWQQQAGAVWVDFPDAAPFANFNTLADLQKPTPGA